MFSGRHRSRAHTGCSTENMTNLRRLALNLLKSEQTKKRGSKDNQLDAG
jgi:predicted transposase YbfD/YdcC